MNKKVDGIVIEDVLKKLESLPVDKYASRRYQWAPWQDDVLLTMWPISNKRAVAEAVGCCEAVCRRRYKELIASNA